MGFDVIVGGLVLILLLFFLVIVLVKMELENKYLFEFMVEKDLFDLFFIYVM